MQTIERPRATIIVRDEKTTKTFRDSKVFEAERNWYINTPWACPKLLSAKDNVLTIETGQLARFGKVSELLALLERLQRNGIHHRDVHPKNIVYTPDGMRLIDWETACLTESGAPSYDLYGPEISGIKVPKVHRDLGKTKNSPNGYAMWLGADHPASVKNQWRKQENELCTEA